MEKAAFDRFRYVGLSRSGVRVTGDVVGSSRVSVIASLDAKGITLLSLDRLASLSGSFETFGARALYLFHGIRLNAALLTLFRSLAVFEKRGVLIQRAVALCMTSCSNPRLRDALRGVLDDIADNGLALHDAFEARPGEFSPTIVAMVKAGQSGAGFALVLERIAKLLTRGKRVGSKIQQSMVYPAMLLLGLVGYFVFVCTSFIPQFTRTMAQLHVKQPPQLTLVASAGSVLTNPLSLTAVLGALVVSVIVLRAVFAQPDVAIGTERFVFRIPFIGALRTKMILGTFARLLGAVLGAGVPYDRALSLVGGALTSPTYRAAVVEMQSDMLARGGMLSTAMTKTGLFQPDFLALVVTGEESSSVAEMLEMIADDYDEDVDRDVLTLTSMLEPILIAVVGAGVMALLALVYAGVYGVITQIK